MHNRWEPWSHRRSARRLAAFGLSVAGALHKKKKEEKMVRITAESGENTRTIEGKAAIVYVMDPAEGGDHAMLALASSIKRLDFLTGGGACNRKPGCRIL